MEVIERNIEELIPATYNPRKLTPKQYENLKQSLDRFGFAEPVIINTHPKRKNIIVGGHQRVKVWHEMGNKTVPCVEVNLTEAKERELNVRLNKNTGEWDWELLDEYYEKDDLIEWGFTSEEIIKYDEPSPDEESVNFTAKKRTKAKAICSGLSIDDDGILVASIKAIDEDGEAINVAKFFKEGKRYDITFKEIE